MPVYRQWYWLPGTRWLSCHLKADRTVSQALVHLCGALCSIYCCKMVMQVKLPIVHSSKGHRWERHVSCSPCRSLTARSACQAIHLLTMRLTANQQHMVCRNLVPRQCKQLTFTLDAGCLTFAWLVVPSQARRRRYCA